LHPKKKPRQIPEGWQEYEFNISCFFIESMHQQHSSSNQGLNEKLYFLTNITLTYESELIILPSL